MIISLADKQTVIDSPETMYEFMKYALLIEDEVDRDKEHFWVVHLNARSTIKQMELVSMGTLTASLVHPREVFTRAIALRSTSLVLGHNHPSGETKPSDQDIVLTNRLVEAGEILGINIVDHLIISLDGFTSFKERGLIR